MIEGDDTAGFSIFWADEGLDTGPILLQKSCKVNPNDTLDSLYNNFLYPEGIKAMAEAVNLVAKGTAPMIPQTEEGATYDPMLNKKELQKVDWTKPAKKVHDFIRGLSSTPGAWTTINGEEVRLFGSTLWTGDELPKHRIEVNIDDRPGYIHEDGLLINTIDNKFINVERIKIGNKTLYANKFDQESEDTTLEFTEEEQKDVEILKSIWESILKTDVDEATDFFACGVWKSISINI